MGKALQTIHNLQSVQHYKQNSNEMSFGKQEFLFLLKIM